MGTRSTTHIYNGMKSDENKLVSTYKQFDGYLDGYGNELFDFLNGYEVLNGYTQEHEKSENKYANGMGCLAAQLIRHFKNQYKLGGYYITNASDSQAYDYHIYFIDNLIMVDVFSGSIIFSGSLVDFGLFIESEA